MVTIRASSLDRVLLCPGSLTLVPLVAPRDGQEGDEGTALHWLAHSEMVKDMAAVGDPGPTPVMPPSLAFSHWISDYYVRTVRDIVPADWSLEVEAALAYEFGRFALSGHIDSLAMSPDATEAVFFDLKTGYDPVDPADCNEQCFGYGCLLLQAYPSLRRVTGYIVQPRNDEDEGFQRISRPMILEGDVLANSISTLTRRVNTALDNAMTVETGMRQCKWCPAAMQCPAQIELRKHMKATITPEYLATLTATPDDAAIAEIVMTGRTIARPLEDAEKLLKDRIRANGEAAGIRIMTEGGSYSYPDPHAFYRATRNRVPDDAKYAATVKPSMTALRAVLAEVTGLPKTAKKGESVASIIDSEFKPLAVQGVREKLVFPS